MLSVTRDRGLVLQRERFKHRIASKDVSSYKIVRRGQLVYSPIKIWEGGLGVLQTVEEGLVSPVYKVWAFRQGDPAFFHYLLRSPPLISRYAQYAEGTGQRRQSLRKNDFLSLEVVVPAIDQQRRIANGIATVEKGLAAHELVVARMEPVARAVRERLETASDWPRVALQEVAQIATGATPPTREDRYWNGSVPFVRTAEISGERITSTSDCVSAEAVAEGKTRVFPTGSVFLAMYGQGRTRGNVALLDVDAATSQNTAAITCDRSRLDPEFLFLYLRGQYESLRAEGAHGHYPHLNASYVRQLEVPSPPLADQARYVAALSRLGTARRAEVLQMNAIHGVFDAAVSNLAVKPE